MPSLKDFISVKKLRFLLFSLLLTGFPYYLAVSGQTDIFSKKFVILYSLAGSLGSLIIQYLEGGERNLRNLFFISFAPLLILSGLFGSLYFFPNLSIYIKLASLVFFGAILYSLFLVNNVVVVVGYRKKVIPLYRAAVNWIQVILLCSAIPFFSSVFKLPVFPPIQLALIFIVSFIICKYLIWIFDYDEETKKLGRVEEFILCASSSFMVFIGAAAVSFLPAESFMRALFVVSILLGVLNYIQMHLRNALNRAFVTGFYIRGIFFFALVFLFS